MSTAGCYRSRKNNETNRKPGVWHYGNFLLNYHCKMLKEKNYWHRKVEDPRKLNTDIVSLLSGSFSKNSSL